MMNPNAGKLLREALERYDKRDNSQTIIDGCAECELGQKVQQLEEVLQWACNRLHQWSPWNNGCHFKACWECPDL